tara:strand:- start:118 stop:261 length:144 start_codon:yes stop_codon:yes gene_type:complete
MDFLKEPAFWVIVAAISEVIGMTPKLKENSILQLIMKLLGAIKPKKG